MSWHLVAGVALPDAVGGHPGLDFCNTRAGWGAPRPKEYLVSPPALALWAFDAGLVRADRSADAVVHEVTERCVAADEETAALLARALALREALYRCALGRGTPADWDVVTREALAARAASRLVPGEGRARWEPLPGRDLVLLGLHAAAACAEDLLTCRPAGTVAACPGTGCGWLFTDPRRRRRWCSMAVCGNRAKARRHAERRGRTSGPPAPTLTPAATPAPSSPAADAYGARTCP